MSFPQRHSGWSDEARKRSIAVQQGKIFFAGGQTIKRPERKNYPNVWRYESALKSFERHLKGHKFSQKHRGVVGTWEGGNRVV